MHGKVRHTLKSINQTFVLFLISQSVSNFGDALRSIAIIALLHKITGSGLSTGLSLIYLIIPGILLSPFAGSIGDILPEKYIIMAVELIRSAVIILFIKANNAALIYIFLVVLSSLDIINNPPLRKMIVQILGRNRILTGNSLFSGMLSITNIIGSLFAGIIISLWGIKTIFLLNSILHTSSAILVAFIKIRNPTVRPGYRHRKRSLKHLFINVKYGLDIMRNTKPIRNIIITSTVISFVTISINVAFYPFAFDILKVTAKGWSVIMTIFYISNILAMLISLRFRRKIARLNIQFVYILLCIVSAIWFSYSIINNLLSVMLLQLFEGMALSLCGIFLFSKLQAATKSEFMARIIGTNDFISSIGKTAGIGYTFIVINLLSVRRVFAINSLIILIYILWGQFSTTQLHQETTIRT